MKTYRYAYEKRYGIKIPKGFEIHHIDWNHENNEMGNLLLIPKELHEWLHYYANMILSKGATPEEIVKFKTIKNRMLTQETARYMDNYADIYDGLLDWVEKKEIEDYYIFTNNRGADAPYDMFRSNGE